MAVLQRLAQHFEHVAMELRQLVQEEDAAMRQAHLARQRMRAAAQQPRIRDGVVRRPEGTVEDQRLMAFFGFPKAPVEALADELITAANRLDLQQAGEIFPRTG